MKNQRLERTKQSSFYLSPPPRTQINKVILKVDFLWLRQGKKNVGTLNRIQSRKNRNRIYFSVEANSDTIVCWVLSSRLQKWTNYDNFFIETKICDS